MLSVPFLGLGNRNEVSLLAFPGVGMVFRYVKHGDGLCEARGKWCVTFRISVLNGMPCPCWAVRTIPSAHTDGRGRFVFFWFDCT